MLEVKKLTKKFGSNTAVSHVTFGVKPGEIFSLIGPNGSGKTTIIKIIAGLLRPTAGKVLVGGFDITEDAPKAKAEIGYIPDEPSVWPVMTGEEFLNFTGALFNMDEHTRMKRIPPLLNIFSLAGLGKGYFEDYSRGNKQKFSVLAALLHAPKLLLIDEPIVGLDPKSAEIAKDEFAKFAKNGGAVLLATHTLSVAQELSSRIGVLKSGKLVAAGTFSELVHHAKLKSGATLEDVYMALT